MPMPIAARTISDLQIDREQEGTTRQPYLVVKAHTAFNTSIRSHATNGCKKNYL